MAVDPDPSWNIELDETILQDLYAWIDQIPLSRPKKRIERDFSDGVMVAELVKYYFPNWVELHNYAQANNTQQKMINWGLLNRKVFSRFGLNVPEQIMRGISMGKTGLVETFLYNLRIKIDDYLYGMENNQSDPEYRNLFRANNQFKQTPRTELQTNEGYQTKIPPANKPNFPPPLNKNASNGHDFVPRLLYEEKEQDCMAKEEQIQILNAKIRRLEHLLHLKDVRLQDMTEKLEKSSKIRK